MRLTLRTMLACLDADDRLDPADAEELASKIEQSKHASDLAQRIRRVVQHPRLSSPRLDGKGMGLDPNSVGEYLDNVLAHDRIAEFERMCLASDIQLAEVSACHQILVLVLEQPAEFEPALRDRIYRIGAESSRRQAEATSEVRPGPNNTSVRIDRPAEATAPIEPATVQPKPKPEVPEYLRAGRKTSLWPLVAAALLAFVIVGLGLRAMGPLDNTHPMARLLRGNTEVAQVPEEQQPVVPVPTEDKQPQETTTPDSVRPTTPGEPETTETPDMPAADANKLPTENFPPDMPDVPMDTKPVEPPLPMDTDPLPMEPLPTDPPVKTTPPVVAGNNPADPPVPAMDVGKFASEDQVLVRFDKEGAQWLRVPARAQLFTGDELVVFPAFRPQVVLATSIQLTLTGETKVVMGPVNDEGVSQLHVQYGRLLASNLARGNSRLALDLPGMQGTVVFGDADSELALEVRKYLPPGQDPEMSSTINVIRLYATRGKLTWQEGPTETPGQSYEINAGEVRNYVGRDPGETLKVAALPDWIDGKNIVDIDRRAAHELQAKLIGDRPLELTLTEMASEMERRAEMRAIAVRSLAFLDKFEPFVAAFNSEDQRSYWTSEFDVLQSAVARSPETAAEVREAFEKLRGQEQGAILFRMLWGYSPEELKSTELPVELVKFLDVDALDFRIFAFENLRRITGSNQLYRPDFNAARRRTPVTQWTNRLREGGIVYKVPPAPIMDSK